MSDAAICLALTSAISRTQKVEEIYEAALDWELTHIGDPLEDIGWVCTNSWRFGVADKVVGGFGDLPDLLVVDGGRGQLGVALSAARDLGLHDLSIVGLAKERENLAGEKMVDRVYLPGQKNGIPLRSTSAALFFLARARDEAHRFANHARKKLGNRGQSSISKKPKAKTKSKKRR